MTIYWDRTDGRSRGYRTSDTKGGVPQDYAVWVERDTGEVRILRMLLNESVNIRSSRNGERFSIPNKRWGYPTEYLNWASGRDDLSPEDYLRRCFMEAALMYESASLGSMIRVEATKGSLAAVFGVEIKRTARTSSRTATSVLNGKGGIARIFTCAPAYARYQKRQRRRQDALSRTPAVRMGRSQGWHHRAGPRSFHLTDLDVGFQSPARMKQASALTCLAARRSATSSNNTRETGMGAWR